MSHIAQEKQLLKQNPHTITLKLVHYARRYGQTIEYTPERGTWALAIRKGRESTLTVLYVKASPTTLSRGSTNPDLPAQPLYVYSIEKFQVDSAKMDRPKDPQYASKKQLKETEGDLAPHLPCRMDIRLEKITFDSKDQRQDAIERLEATLRGALRRAVHGPTEPEWIVSQRWVGVSLAALSDAGFSVSVLTRDQIVQKFV
ncbi:hypothetical protein CC2G_002618 [Coprinopsis cinerea AmutBmut pab1-1]|nr:hypothetical protein CC2G_002618 [Coprinopsis cinerea AmutBmut pab1-1]